MNPGPSAGQSGQRLRVLPGDLAVVRLGPESPLPDWALRGSFHALVRTGRELSLVCASADVPAEARQEGPFRALEVEGPLDFSLTGILAELLGPLAQAGISVFTLSTFDTDYVLVRADRLEAAARALEAAGHAILSG